MDIKYLIVNYQDASKFYFWQQWLVFIANYSCQFLTRFRQLVGLPCVEWQNLSRWLLGHYGENELWALVELGLNNNGAFELRHYFLANKQTQADSVRVHLPCVFQGAEHLEEISVISQVHAYSTVSYRHNDFGSVFLPVNCFFFLSLFACVALDGTFVVRMHILIVCIFLLKD